MCVACSALLLEEVWGRTESAPGKPLYRTRSSTLGVNREKWQLLVKDVLSVILRAPPKP